MFRLSANSVLALLLVVQVRPQQSHADVPISKQCSEALDNFYNPPLEVINACTVGGGMIVNGSYPVDPEGSFKTDPRPMYERRWAKMCSPNCIMAQDALYRDISQDCGTEFLVDVSDGETTKRIPAIQVFYANIITRKLLCLRTEGSYCYYEMLGVLNGDNRNASKFTCSNCSRMIYASQREIDQRQFDAVRSLIREWLDVIARFLTRVGETCGPDYYQNLPPIPEFPSSEVSSSVSLSPMMKYLLLATLLYLV